MEVLSLRNLKVIYIRWWRASIIFPPQCLRCIGWNLLLLFQIVVLRNEVSESYIADVIGTNLWSVGVLMAVLSGVLSILTVFTDPGILPPININALSPEDQARLQSPPGANGGYTCAGSSGYGGGYEMQSPNSILERVNPNLAQHDVGMQPFCRKCQHLRPPMTAHCWWTDVCIVEMDHYCSILGVVVGARNLRWFMLYLLSMMLTSFMGAYATFKSLEVVFASGPRLMLFMAIIFAAMIAFAGTTFFFTKGIRLIWSGQSTRGEIKGLQTSSAALKGWPAIMHVLFPQMPSLLPIYFDELYGGGGDENGEYGSSSFNDYVGGGGGSSSNGGGGGGGVDSGVVEHHHYRETSVIYMQQSNMNSYNNSTTTATTTTMGIQLPPANYNHSVGDIISSRSEMVTMPTATSTTMMSSATGSSVTTSPGAPPTSFTSSVSTPNVRATVGATATATTAGAQ